VQVISIKWGFFGCCFQHIEDQGYLYFSSAFSWAFHWFKCWCAPLHNKNESLSFYFKFWITNLQEYLPNMLELVECVIQSTFCEQVPAEEWWLWWGGGLLVGGLKGCYWWKTVWSTRVLHCYIQTENIEQWRVACSECTFTVYGGCCDNVLQWITLNSWEHMKPIVLFVQWLWNKCFQVG
jgi:hypothetical protein